MEEQNKHREWLKSHEGLRFLVNVNEGNISQKWKDDYKDEKYDPSINVIEIGKKEIVLEYDETSKIQPDKQSTKEQREKWMQEVLSKAEKENIQFELHDHKGKCPHLTLPLNKESTKEEKEAIMKYYAPEESWEFLDMSLCGTHLIAVPYAKHWKYGTIKELIKKGGNNPINVADSKFEKYFSNENRTFIIANTSGLTAKIVSRIKISDLALEYGAKRGTNNMYHCCFHDDKNPSLSLDDRKGFFKCFADSCKKEGNIVDFVAEAEHMSREEAIKKLIERAGINYEKIQLKDNQIEKIKNKINNLNTEDNDRKQETLRILKELIHFDDLEVDEFLDLLAHKTKYKITSLRKALEKLIKEEKNKQRLTQKIETDKLKYNDDELRNIVLMHLYKSETEKATEILCIEIQRKEYIYTTRDDEKSEVWIYQDGIYIPNGKTYIREFCRLILGESYSSYLANLVISKIEADTYTDAKDFFKEAPVEEIPVKNGLLNIFTKTLSPFTPEKKFFTKIPVEYIPPLDCPLIKKFLGQIHKHEEDILITQEFFGYCLLRDYRIEKAIMLTGDGRNGKGRELEILKRFLGPENCVNIQLQDIEKDSFALSEFHGRLANISGDISKEAIEHSGNFKMLTGEDLITANRKFKVRISFVNYAKQMYSANEIPKTYDLKDAFFLRWVILEYPFKFLSQKELNKLTEEQKNMSVNGRPKYNLADKEIVSKITTDSELSGLLNWALEGLSRLLHQRDFSYSKSLAEVRNLWIRKSDSFMAFCMDSLVAQYNGIITKDDLRKKYFDYCKKHNVPAEGDRAIKETLNREYGVTDSQKTVFINNDPNNKKISYIWEGIKFKDEE